MMEVPSTPGLIASPETSPLKLNRAGNQHQITGGAISGEKESSSERIVEEIDKSTLLQDELRRPSLASASSFLSVICGGTSKDKGVKKTGEVQGRASVSKLGAITP